MRNQTTFGGTPIPLLAHWGSFIWGQRYLGMVENCATLWSGCGGSKKATFFAAIPRVRLSLRPHGQFPAPAEHEVPRSPKACGGNCCSACGAGRPLEGKHPVRIQRLRFQSGAAKRFLQGKQKRGFGWFRENCIVVLRWRGLFTQLGSMS